MYAGFLCFFWISGFLDTDFVVYYPVYEDAPTLADPQGVLRFFSGVNKDYLLKIEPGFKALIILLKSISEDYFFLQIVSALIDVLFLNYFLRSILLNMY